MNTRHSPRTGGDPNHAIFIAVAGVLIAISSFAQSPAPAQNAAPAASQPAAALAGSDKPSFQVKEQGQGVPIIMIPGLASSGATWNAAAAHLATHYRCIQLTLPGFAGVPAVSAPFLSTAREQIAAYIRDNHLDHPIVMGHSLGGSIALDLAARYPDLVGPVVIVDSLPFMAGAWFQAGTLADAQPTIDKMRSGMNSMTAEQWQAMTRSGASTNAMASNEKDQKTLIAWGLASDQKTVINAMIELVSSDLRPELSRIQSPVLVIGTWVGLKNYGVTEDTATVVFHQQFSSVRNLQFVMSKDARHFVMWDNPAWFNTQVDTFLAGSARLAAGR
jgi:pimeloyl-ACP methyl ester carboxylesterase